MPPFTNPIIQVENAGQFFYQCCIAGIMLETVAPSKSVKSWFEFNYKATDMHNFRKKFWKNHKIKKHLLN